MIPDDLYLLFLCLSLTCLNLSQGQFIISFPKYMGCEPPRSQVCIEFRECPEPIPAVGPFYDRRDRPCGFYTCCNRTTAFSSSQRDTVDHNEENTWNEPSVFNRVFGNVPTGSQEFSSGEKKAPVLRSCKLSMGELCVKLRQCPFFDTLVQNSPRPLPKAVFNIIERHHCGDIENVPYVCCNVTKSPKTPVAIVKNDAASVVSGSVMTHPNYEMLPKNCGPVMTDLLSSRITNGVSTDLNEFPWMALLAYRTGEDGDVIFKCAGTLINERFVLTAAHCILDSTIAGVRLGEYNVDVMEDCDENSFYCAPATQDIPIENILVHPDYDKWGWKNDIALIKLAVPANFTDNVQPICLPTDDVDLTGKFVTISGWGVTENRIQSSILRKASVPVLDLSECRKVFKKIPPTALQICAGGSGGADSCAGDSGGPLKIKKISEGTARFVQLGIVSYGSRQCGTRGVPAVYTRVFSYMNWILGNLDTN